MIMSGGSLQELFQKLLKAEKLVKRGREGLATESLKAEGSLSLL